MKKTTKASVKYFLEDDDQEIIKRDQAGNWYTFRHGAWQNSNNPIQERLAQFKEYSNLASARKAALERWIAEFEKFKVEAMPEGFNKKNAYYQAGDEDAPFWSEGFLYPLLGKEDARSLLARLRRLHDISRAY